MALDPVTTGAILGAGKGLIKGKGIEGIATDAAMGAAGGYMGGKLPFGDMFSGVNSTGATTATNSLQGGANLLGGTGTAAATNTGNLLSTSVNTGLNNVTSGVTGQGFSPYATPDTLGQSVTADSLGQYGNLGLNTTNAVVDPLTGLPAGPNFSDMPRLQETPLYTGNVTPNFANITKSTPEELAKQTGGYTEKPVYEKAFDSVVGFAEQNPMAIAGLGLTALSSANRPAPPITAQQAGKVIKGTYTQPTPYQMRRA